MIGQGLDTSVRVLRGELQGSPSSDLHHPALKLFLVFLPLGTGMWFRPLQQRYAIPQLSLVELLWIGLLTYTCVHIEISRKQRRSMIGRMIIALLAFLLLLYVGDHDVPFIRDIYESIPLVSIAEPTSWAIIFLFLVSATAIRTISSRDALWMGRRTLGRGRLYEAYVTAMAVFFVVQNGLGRRMATVIHVVGTKFFLGSREGIWRRPVAAVAALRAFGRLLIREFKEMAGLSVSMLYERGFFIKHLYADRYARVMCRADFTVLIVLIVGLAGVILLHGRSASDEVNETASPGSIPAASTNNQ